MFSFTKTLKQLGRTIKNTFANFPKIWRPALVYSIPATIKLTASAILLITPFAIYNRIKAETALKIIKRTMIAGLISYPFEIFLAAYNYNRMLDQYNQSQRGIIRPEDKMYQNISHPHIDFLETSSSLLLLFWAPTQNPLWYLLGGATLGLRTYFGNQQARNHNIQATNYLINNRKSRLQKIIHGLSTVIKRTLDIGILFLNYAAPIFDVLSYVKKQISNVDTLGRKDKSHFYAGALSISAVCVLFNMAYLISKFRTVKENKFLRTGGSVASCLGALSIAGNQTLRITVSAYLAIMDKAEIETPIWLNVLFLVMAFGFGGLCAKVERKRYLSELSHITWAKRNFNQGVIESTATFFIGQREQASVNTELQTPLSLLHHDLENVSESGNVRLVLM